MLHPFDPWKSRVCTCADKYSLDPYTGCGHGCLYCYITSYIPRAFEPRPKRDFLRRLARDLSRAEVRPVSLSNSSDPYQPLERDHLLTRGTLRLLRQRGFPAVILTKSDMFVRDLDILSGMNAVISVTITSMDRDLASRLEPHAPTPRSRIEALGRVEDIPKMLRLDPVIPGLNDDPSSLREVVEAAVDAGVRSITASTYKARPDSLRRLADAFPDLDLSIYSLGRRVGNARYLPDDMRREILMRIRQVCMEVGVAFSTCREAIPGINTTGCDGIHLLGP